MSNPAADICLNSFKGSSYRVLISNASALAGIGVLLAATVHKKWLILPGVVLGFLLQHGLQGWCPPLPLFRKLGVRSFKEIDRERFALKYLRQVHQV